MTAMTRPGPAHNPDRSEEPWFEATIDELAELRRALEEDFDQPVQVANGIVGAIIARTYDSLGTPTRARYRRLLREVGPPPSQAPKRRRVRAERGYSTVQTAGDGALAGAVLVMARFPAVGASLAVLGAVAHNPRDGDIDAAKIAVQRLPLAA
jgi:hypothetical protein